MAASGQSAPGANTETDHEVAVGSQSPASTADTRELVELRELLLGGERRQLEELRRRLDNFEVSPDEMAEHLPEAIAIRGARDGQLAHALAPTIQGAIGESVRRNPREIATAIVPVLGPAIRKAIAEAMARNPSRFLWFIPVVLLLGLGAVFLARSNQRWSRAVTALEQEPGIVLIRADRGLGGWRFTGLRDPLAANPAALLAGLGIDTASIDTRWEPYVSTQPPLVLGRARRILAPPGTVDLTLAGDTLIARGQASRRWRERTETIATALPGVAYVDFSGVADAVPAELESLRREAAELRVLFPAGSDSLDSAGRVATDSISAHLIRLHAAGVRAGYVIAVVLVGRADSLGPATARLALSSRRAEVVRAALIASGVPSTAIEVRPLGSTDRFRAANPQSAARINRSVSLEVTVSDEGSIDREQ